MGAAGRSQRLERLPRHVVEPVHLLLGPSEPVGYLPRRQPADVAKEKHGALILLEIAEGTADRVKLWGERGGLENRLDGHAEASGAAASDFSEHRFLSNRA